MPKVAVKLVPPLLICKVINLVFADAIGLPAASPIRSLHHYFSGNNGRVLKPARTIHEMSASGRWSISSWFRNRCFEAFKNNFDTKAYAHRGI